MTPRCLLFIALLLLSCTRFCFAQSPSIRFVDEGGTTLAEVKAVVQRRGLYLPIEALRETFDQNLKHGYIPLTKKLTLNLKGKQINLHVGNSSAMIDEGDATISLPRPPRIIQGAPMLPIEFFSELLPQVYDVDVFYNAPVQTIYIKEKTALIPNVPHTSSSEKKAEFTLIVDPGHGGSDAGCRGTTGRLEKDIVLDLAKQIETLCQENHIRVQLTRRADVERRPIERIQIANQNQGGLFLSLHCNASFSPNAEGIHLYVNNSLGELRSEGRLRLSNATSLRPAIKVLAQDDFLTRSRKFAGVLQEELASLVNSPILLTEMPLVTLSGVYMPAILIEIGYLSNVTDEDRLADAEELASMAIAIFGAVQRNITEFNQEGEAVNGR
jgi:N-acetylmuramoyl-L-alanine amidase